MTQSWVAVSVRSIAPEGGRAYRELYPSVGVHWAMYLIGQRWPRNGCFLFVADLVLRRLGVVLPGVDEVRSSNWRRTPMAESDDVVLMTGPDGRHVGLWVETPARVGVLHAHGQVMFESLATIKEHGYGSFEFWRLNRA